MTPNFNSQYFKTSDGNKIFYSTNFKVLDLNKELLVFNYGLACSNGHWSKQIPYFDQHNYQIILHNYRGHFNSDGVQDLHKCTIKQFAIDLNEILDSINAKQFFMLGHSMGVNVTLEFARLFQEKLKGMIVISGTIFPPQDVMFNSNLMDLFLPYWKLIKEKFPKTYQFLWKTSGRNPIFIKMIKDGGFNKKMVPDQFIHEYLNRMGQLSPDLFFKLLDEMGQHDIINYLEKIKTPTLIMGGDKDQVIPNYIQRVLNKYLEKSELYIVKEGSHVPQVDFPETINQRIQLFLEHYS